LNFLRSYLLRYRGLIASPSVTVRSARLVAPSGLTKNGATFAPLPASGLRRWRPASISCL
jgi:hypothetical protein